VLLDAALDSFISTEIALQAELIILQNKPWTNSSLPTPPSHPPHSTNGRARGDV